MSRSLLRPWGARQTRVQIGPMRIAISGGKREQPPRVVEVLPPEPGLGSSTAEPWRASTDSLRSALLSMRARGLNLEIILSEHFVRYALVPWSEDLVRDVERVAFARLAFREIYGALAEGWDICLDEAPVGEPALACAADRSLLNEIQDAAVSVGARVDKIAPSLADCINRHRRTLQGQQFCLANVEARRVTFAFRTAAGWHAIRSRRLDGPVHEDLPTLLKQEASAAGAAESGVLYLCAYDVPFAEIGIPGWKVTRLVDTTALSTPNVDSRLVRAQA